MFVYFSPIGTRLQIDDRSNQKTRIKRNKSLHNLIDGSRVENVKHHVWNKHPTEPRSVLGLTQVSRTGTLSNVFFWITVDDKEQSSQNWISKMCNVSFCEENIENTRSSHNSTAQLPNVVALVFAEIGYQASTSCGRTEEQQKSNRDH